METSRLFCQIKLHGRFPGGGIRLQNLGHAGILDDGDTFHGLSDLFRDVQKTDLTGQELGNRCLVGTVQDGAGAAAGLIPIIVDYAVHVLEDCGKSQVYLTGQNRLLGHPEYQDLGRAREILGALDEDTISNLPAKLDPNSSMQILVGPENVAQELKDTSVVVTRFDIGDGMQGMIGVVGPQRMDYAQITARLSYFAEGLGRMFGKPELPSGNKEET